MRIVFANPIAALGGAELYLLEMLAELRERNPSAELHLVADDDGPMLERAARMRVECHRLPMSAAMAAAGDSSVRWSGQSRFRQAAGMGLLVAAGSVSMLAYARRFRRLLRSLQPSIVFSNGLKFHVVTALAGYRDARLVWFMHDYLSSRALMRRMLPRLSGSVSLVLANSQSVAADVKQVLPRPRMEILYCGIDRSQFSPGRGDHSLLDRLAELSPLPEGAVRVGLVATYARWKGQDRFLEAAALTRKAGWPCPVRFYIIGGPIYSTHGSQFTVEELRQIAAQNGISEHVGFVPFQDDTAQIYRSLDVVVHASRHPEPFGRTILEAMSCGRAVIATQSGGAAELFENGESALGYPLDNVTELASAMYELIVSPDKRSELGRRAVVATESFSRSNMGSRLQAYLKAL